jgi:putative GTP pyrophosphokinase
MHAWASLSHQLSYKVENEIPLQFRRQVFQLSALFELADQEFDRLRAQKTSYHQQLIEGARTNSQGFDSSQPLNIDSLQAFLDFNFPDRDGSQKMTKDLLEDLLKNDVDLADLTRGLATTSKVLPRQERGEFGSPGNHWAQVGIARHILDLTHDGWWRWRVQTQGVPSDVIERVKKDRKEL